MTEREKKYKAAFMKFFRDMKFAYENQIDDLTRMGYYIIDDARFCGICPVHCDEFVNAGKYAHMSDEEWNALPPFNCEEEIFKWYVRNVE